MVKVSKTIGPLHFEDLDPHRFEDLVRQLVYDFRDWQSIEATGRGGDDEGFDIRAWEKVQEITNRDEEENTEGIHPMEGNLWEVQCKREKAIGPSKVKKIIDNNIKKDDPPYGYILVAPVNFSKKSYDMFRDELREIGVMEFYLWGREELEDMLHMPKNDYILFTFFGVSLVTRKRSKVSEIKFAVNNKNKLLRILSEGVKRNHFYKPILIRDFKDNHYPWKEDYKDFDEKPRWKEYIFTAYHPLGLIILVYERYAFVDFKKKEWGFTESVNLVNKLSERNKGRYSFDKQKKVEYFWRHLPMKNQAKLIVKGCVNFNDILIIDKEGDVLYDFPHIFVDFRPKKGPFDWTWSVLEVNGQKIEITEDFKKVDIFPSEFPAIKRGKIYENKSIEWDDETVRLFRDERIRTLFDVEGKYNYLNPKDIIKISIKNLGSEEEIYAEVTHKYTTNVEKYLEDKNHNGSSFSMKNIETQVRRKVKGKEKITIFELNKLWGWEIKKLLNL